jgi:hypothetical protein
VVCVTNFLRGVLTLSAMALIPIGTWSTAATAQLQPEAHLGSRIPVQPHTFKEDKTKQVLADFASCVVKKQRALASQFVLDRTTLDFGKKYKPLADGNCLIDVTGTYFAEVGLTMGGETMRFALAEALVRGELATIDPAKLANAARLQIPLLTAADYEPKVDRQYREADLKALEGRRNKDQLALIMYRFGECAVRAAPQNARALLQAPANSDAEGTAFQSMMPAFSACLEKGSQFKLNRSVLRGTIAFSYYSLAHAPAAAATVSTASRP